MPANGNATTARARAEVGAAACPVILVGHPNVGKSALFGALTGTYVDVSNYPGTTVEVSAGRVHGRELIDTPGIQSLSGVSEDERVTRDILLAKDESVIVQVADARNLRRTLLLALQLAELERPFILDLNMVDEAQASGITLDARRVGRMLGTEVVETVAVKRRGVTELGERFASARPASQPMHYDAPIELAVRQIVSMLPPGTRGARAIALMILARNERVSAAYLNGNEDAVGSIVAEAAAGYAKPLGFEITQQRLRWVDRLLTEAERRGVENHGVRNAFGRLALHPVWGWPILLGVLYALYLLVGHLGAGVMVDWMESVVFGAWINPVATRLASGIPIPWLVDLLVGEYGVVTMALAYGIAIVMPIVLTFFIAFGLLEDSGYLPRLAVLMNRPFRAMGLNGKAVLPMVLGLGCDTMATLTTRILDTRKDRVLVTLLLALGVPCSAQLGVLLGMTALMPAAAVVTWIAVVVGVLWSVGWVAAKLIPGERSDFILELPPIRMPMLGNIVIKTLARMEWYLKEVLPLFVLGTIVLFVLDRSGGLKAAEAFAAPLVQKGLGLPAEATGMFIIGFLRRDYGAAGLFSLARADMMSVTQLLVSLVVITLFVPCIANVFVIIKEHKWKTAARVVGFVFPFAFVVGMVLNQVLRWLGVTFE